MFNESSSTPQLQALPVLFTLVNSPLPQSTCPGVTPSSPMVSWRDTAWSTSPARLWMVRSYTTLKAFGWANYWGGFPSTADLHHFRPVMLF